jgi:flagellar biosynthesis chaperone FliJ
MSILSLIDIFKTAHTLFQIFGLQEKLIQNKREAANQLVRVINEIDKIYKYLDGILVDLLTLGIYTNQNEENDSNNIDSINIANRTLLRFNNLRLESDIESVRGSCSEIRRIYETYLNTWFNKLISDKKINKKEYDDLEAVFDKLSSSDDDLIHSAQSLINYLNPWISILDNQLKNKEYKKFNETIDQLSTELNDFRDEISKSTFELIKLKNSYLEITRTLSVN